jgi:hypothetical protein
VKPKTKSFPNAQMSSKNHQILRLKTLIRASSVHQDFLELKVNNAKATEKSKVRQELLNPKPKLAAPTAAAVGGLRVLLDVFKDKIDYAKFVVDSRLAALPTIDDTLISRLVFV